MRGDNPRSREPPSQLFRDGALVPRVAKREQRADGDGFRLEFRKRIEVEVANDAFRPDPLFYTEAPLEWHERLWMVFAEPIEMRPRLPAQVEQVLESRGGDEGRPRPFALEQRVRRD